MGVKSVLSQSSVATTSSADNKKKQPLKKGAGHDIAAKVDYVEQDHPSIIYVDTALTQEKLKNMAVYIGLNLITTIIINHASFNKLSHVNFLKVLPNCNSLQTLDLIGCKLKPFQVSKIIKALSNLNQLQNLVLAYNKLGAAGTKELIALLANKKSIHYLALNSTGLTDKNLCDLVNDGAFKNIEYLFLTKNTLSVTGVTALAKHLSQGSKIKRLSMMDCALDDQSLSLLIDAIIVSRALEQLFLDRNDFSASLIERGMKVYKKHKSLKILSLSSSLPADELTKRLQGCSLKTKNSVSYFKKGKDNVLPSFFQLPFKGEPRKRQCVLGASDGVILKLK